MARARTLSTFTVLLVVTVIMASLTPVLARQTVPRPSATTSLAKVGLYPTQVVATVKSLERVKSASLDSDLRSSQTLFLIKLSIHTSKPLTLQGTVIDDGESLSVVSRQPLDATSIGKTITAQIEMRGDSTRQRWLVTEIVSSR